MEDPIVNLDVRPVALWHSDMYRQRLIRRYAYFLQQPGGALESVGTLKNACDPSIYIV
ncbi:hypothetical protein BD310DRAFT_935153 [Dichomitus squalens]|uniref:Uncharacterized protein n=1 Tax=Dichomitus squalens TaxID=114155 RepID=A0A4V2K748_9APHY|nr:hypothetical protein BD310DRAFT_935153 [Dichomitus squalens]